MFRAFFAPSASTAAADAGTVGAWVGMISTATVEGTVPSTVNTITAVTDISSTVSSTTASPETSVDRLLGRSAKSESFQLACMPPFLRSDVKKNGVVIRSLGLLSPRKRHRTFKAGGDPECGHVITVASPALRSAVSCEYSSMQGLGCLSSAGAIADKGFLTTQGEVWAGLPFFACILGSTVLTCWQLDYPKGNSHESPADRGHWRLVPVLDPTG